MTRIFFDPDRGLTNDREPSSIGLDRLSAGNRLAATAEAGARSSGAARIRSKKRTLHVSNQAARRRFFPVAGRFFETGRERVADDFLLLLRDGADFFTLGCT